MHALDCLPGCSDPHPGNLFKLEDGRLAYIDFGMMGEIQGSIRRSVMALVPVTVA